MYEDLTIEESTQKYIDELKLPKDFYPSLMRENDWSFVIKLSALLEAVCTNILTKKLNNENINKSIAYLDYANKKSGKLNFLEKLDVIDKKQAEVLYKLAELRNKIVHNVDSVNFTFENYITKMDKQQKKSLVSWVGYGIKPEFNIENIKITRHTTCIENTKLSIWITILEIIACIYLDKKITEFKNSLNSSMEKFLLSHSLE